MNLTLAGQWYRWVPTTHAGFETETVELDPKRTAIIGMHCWNIGCPDGPAVDPRFAVGMVFGFNAEASARIMKERIAPAFEVARQAGVTVCHVEPEIIARRHPQACEDEDPPVAPSPAAYAPPQVVPGHQVAMARRAHGPYLEGSPYTRMDRAAVVAPQPGDLYCHQTNQLDRALRRRGIENLIYAGFATDMCVLRAPGGVEPMNRFGYRLFILRDATLGIEYPDTFEQRSITEGALRYFESHFGDSLLTADFISACRRVADAS